MRLRRSNSTPSETRPATRRRATLNSEPQEAGADDRGGERPQVRLALADLVDGAADEVGDEHARRHRDRREREGDDHPLPVGAQEAEESPERASKGLTPYFTK